MGHESDDRTAPVLSPARWQSGAPVPIDFGGPVDRPFDPVTTEEGASDGIGWLERSARLYPDKLAVADDSISYTYSELMDRIHGLAAQIAEVVPVGGVVVTVAHNSAAAAAMMLAAMCAGCTLIPIDAGHPIERQAAIFAASGATVLVSVARTEANLSFVSDAVTRIAFDPTASSGVTGCRAILDSETPAVVIFTSGSTGLPKGLAHAVRASSVARLVAKFHINSDDVFISLASMSQTGIADLMCLAAGATLHVVDVKRRGIGDALEVIRDKGVTFLSFIPSFLRMLIAMPGIEAVVRTLRVLDLHGERILAADIAALRAKLPKNCHISISYGATEVGAVFSWFVRDEAIDGEVAPIGYLMPDKTIAFMTEDGATAEVGEAGTLFVRGHLALGSWTGGRLSSERFFPCADDPNQRIYDMGDRVRLRADGLAEFLGRRDRQVKIRGLWTDLAQIEQALRSAGGVLDAVALVQTTEGESDEIVVFVVPEVVNYPPTESALRAEVIAATADHMAPRQLIFLPEIPRLPNYKPDLIRLRSVLKTDTGTLNERI